jgi:transposase
MPCGSMALWYCASWSLGLRAVRMTIAQLKGLAVQLIALEATGGFETAAAATLGAAGLPVVIVNPCSGPRLR